MKKLYNISKTYKIYILSITVAIRKKMKSSSFFLFIFVVCTLVQLLLCNIVVSNRSGTNLLFYFCLTFGNRLSFDYTTKCLIYIGRQSIMIVLFYILCCQPFLCMPAKSDKKKKSDEEMIILYFCFVS
jgi:hypothetical protein